MTDHGVTAALLDTLEYHAPPLIFRLVGRPAFAGMEPGYARLCMQWLAAITLLRGTVALTDFCADHFADPAVIALAARVKVFVDDNPDPAAFVPAYAIARLRDGRAVRVDVSAQLGSPQWPLTPEQHRAKALGCLAFAGLEHCDDALFAAIGILDRANDAIGTIRSTGIIG